MKWLVTRIFKWAYKRLRTPNSLTRMAVTIAIKVGQEIRLKRLDSGYDIVYLYASGPLSISHTLYNEKNPDGTTKASVAVWWHGVKMLYVVGKIVKICQLERHDWAFYLEDQYTRLI